MKNNPIIGAYFNLREMNIPDKDSILVVNQIIDTVSPGYFLVNVIKVITGAKLKAEVWSAKDISASDAIYVSLDECFKAGTTVEGGV